ncbi:MAG: FecR family protein [Salinivirgaceae bacterium]|jgi:transmembrane sensor|nr:FecR family protein [Salinivirgaceae bacterium]
MKSKQKNIDETLLLRIIEYKADDSEVALFKEWHNESAENAALFAQLKKTYELSSFDKHSTQANWQQVVDKVKTGYSVPDFIELPEPQTARKIIRLNSLLRVAALVALVIGLTFLFKNVVFNSEQLIVSGNDLKNNEPYLLADGSMVYLNSDAEISFSKHFGAKNRKLELKGEAFFEVQRNEKLPFQITSNKTTTKVLGTSFNVFSDLSGNVKVSVVRGVVTFFTDKSNIVELHAGEQGIFDPFKKSLKKDIINDLNFQSWKTGIMKFNETPVNDVFDLLNKHYSKTLLFDDEKGKGLNITTTFDNQSIEAVLEELNLLLNTKNVKKNDTIIFKSNN